MKIEVSSLVLPKAQVDVPALALAEAKLAQLTLEEKVSLCHGASTMSINAIEKIGLTDEFVMSDNSHTVRPDLSRTDFSPAGAEDDHSTNLPPLSALAATWDVDLARRYGDLLGRECRDRGKDMLLGPGINVMRTPLCGRNFEYCGEDPVLAGRMASAHIRGVQERDGVAACVKHYAANNQELNRYDVDARMDERTLREIYLRGFEIAVKEGGALTVMSGYNRFRGEHCSHSDYLNNRILKGEWGFPGFVVTDWGGMHNTVEAAMGGTDVEMNAGDQIRYFNRPLLEAVLRDGGGVPESVVDDKARRVLYVMAAIGKLGAARERGTGSRNTPEHRELARNVAEQAMVLLKNDRHVLPLRKGGIRKLLVVGRNATNRHCHLGWSAEGKPLHEVTPLEGLEAYLAGEDVEIVHASLTDGAGGGVRFEQIPDACLLTTDKDATDQGMTIKGWETSYYENGELSGPPARTGFQRVVEWRGRGEEAERASIRFRATVRVPETGEYALGGTVNDALRIFLDDRKILDDAETGSSRTAFAKVFMEEGAEHTITVEYAQASAESSMDFGWQLPRVASASRDALLESARSSDAVLIFTGNTHGHGRGRECEGGDRPDMRLPEGHDEAIAALLGEARNPNTVVINLSGAPVEMPWIDQADTLLQYWFSGQEGGHALANVLFGEVNPSGKLPFTFPRRLEDSPAHALNQYNDKMVEYTEGVFVGYRWFDAKNIEPLFPFGHGLSYTTFEVGEPKLSAKTITPDNPITVTVTVKNTGQVAGSEVVQVYLHDREASVDRPPKELKAFAKAFLKPGETKELTFTITVSDLAFYDQESGSWTAESGSFEALVGTSSRCMVGRARFVLPES